MVSGSNIIAMFGNVRAELTGVIAGEFVVG